MENVSCLGVAAAASPAARARSLGAAPTARRPPQPPPPPPLTEHDRCRWGRRDVSARAGARPAPPPAAAADAPEPLVLVRSPALNTRLVLAQTRIAAPVAATWAVLTAYERLGEFIPGLTANKCLSRGAGSCILLQVGRQEVALGVRFEARCVLDVREHARGLSDAEEQRLLRPGGAAGGAAPAAPAAAGARSGAATAAASVDYGRRDIAFTLVEGDFSVFQGLWRMRAAEAAAGGNGAPEPESTLLEYAVLVKPQSWLPVALIEGRVRREVAANVRAVRERVEAGG